jgi:hypothetical protein
MGAGVLCCARGWATRLVMRSVDAASGPPLYAFFEPAHFIMERKMMLRIKALAEGRLVMANTLSK